MTRKKPPKKDNPFWKQGKLYEVTQYFEVMPIMTASPERNYKSLFGREGLYKEHMDKTFAVIPGEILFLVKRNYVQVFPAPNTEMFVSYFLDKRGKIIESVFIGPELTPEKYLKRVRTNNI